MFSSCHPVARLLRGITPSPVGENVSVYYIYSVKWFKWSRWLGSHPGSLLAVAAERLYVTGIDGYLQTQSCLGWIQTRHKRFGWTHPLKNSCSQLLTNYEKVSFSLTRPCARLPFFVFTITWASLFPPTLCCLHVPLCCSHPCDVVFWDGGNLSQPPPQSCVSPSLCRVSPASCQENGWGPSPPVKTWPDTER